MSSIEERPVIDLPLAVDSYDQVAVEHRRDHDRDQTLLLADHIDAGASALVAVDGEVTPEQANDLLEAIAQSLSEVTKRDGGGWE